MTRELLLVHRKVVDEDRARTGRLCALGAILDDSDLHCNLPRGSVATP